MDIIIGSARIDERGRISGGAKGDQKQTSKPDYKGEVSLESFYVHKKGWYVLRPKSVSVAKKIAANMDYACNNKCLGYSQSDRYGVIAHGVHTTVNTNCDCSSLVRKCIAEAANKDPGDFNTSSEADVLERSGLFKTRVRYTTGMILYEGDVLVTCTKGHTVIVVVGKSRSSSTSDIPKSNGNKSITQIAKEVIEGKWGSGDNRRVNLSSAGYDYAEVQREVNKLLSKGSSTPNLSKPQSIANAFKIGSSYKTIVDALNVRTSPNGAVKSKVQLSADAQKSCNSKGQLRKGTVVTCKEVKISGTQVWMKIPSGWICAHTGTEYYVK